MGKELRRRYDAAFLAAAGNWWLTDDVRWAPTLIT